MKETKKEVYIKEINKDYKEKTTIIECSRTGITVKIVEKIYSDKFIKEMEEKIYSDRFIKEMKEEINKIFNNKENINKEK